MQTYCSESYADTLHFAAQLAKTLPKGTVIAFLGGLGAGKTAFVTGLAQGLGIDCDVSSPTFALCNTYIGAAHTLHHYDMYRVNSWDDLYSTGFFDVLDTDDYIAVEWSENIYSALPEDALIVEIVRVSDTARCFKLYKKSEESL